MKKIFLFIFVFQYFLFSQNLESLYELSKTDLKKTYVNLTELEDKCKKHNIVKACDVFNDFMEVAKEKCEFENKGFECHLMAIFKTKLASEEYYAFLKQSCESDDKNYYVASSCNAYSGYLRRQDDNNKALKQQSLFYIKKACALGFENACKKIKMLY